MRSWPKVPLGEVAEIGSGAAFSTRFQGKTGETYPFLKVSDMNLPGNGERILSWRNSVNEEIRTVLRARAFPPGSIIFPKIGAAIATNKKRLLTRASCVDNNVMAVVPRPERLAPEFLLFLLYRKDLSDFASRSNPPSMRKGAVEGWEVPLPTPQRAAADRRSLEPGGGHPAVARASPRQGPRRHPGPLPRHVRRPGDEPEGVADQTMRRSRRCPGWIAGKLQASTVSKRGALPSGSERTSGPSRPLGGEDYPGNRSRSQTGKPRPRRSLGRRGSWQSSRDRQSCRMGWFDSKLCPSESSDSGAHAWCKSASAYAAAFLNSDSGRSALLRAGKTTSGLNHDFDERCEGSPNQRATRRAATAFHRTPHRPPLDHRSAGARACHRAYLERSLMTRLLG